MEEIKDGIPDEQQVLELGIMLGQRRAFGLVAGRCSAAGAECLRKIREGKVYLKFAPNWPGFARVTSRSASAPPTARSRSIANPSRSHNEVDNPWPTHSRRTVRPSLEICLLIPLQLPVI